MKTIPLIVRATRMIIRNIYTDKRKAVSASSAGMALAWINSLRFAGCIAYESGMKKNERRFR